MTNLLFDQQRTIALSIACTDCDATIGEECVNAYTREPLTHQAAHFVRLKASGAAHAGRELARQ